MTLPGFHPHLDVWLVFGSLVVLYEIAARRHARATGERAVSRRQRALFLMGIGTLWVAADWPIHDLGEGYLYHIHMLQHMLFTLVAAPLVITGMPVWMWRGILRPAPVARLWRLLTRPLVALVLFNAVLLFTHWPEVVDASVGSQLVHAGLHVLAVGSALVMWWPVVSPLPELPPLPPAGQMIYLFLQSLAPTIPASFLTFGSSPLYKVYATFPRIWGIDVMNDQLIAGLLMKLGGGLLLWGVIATIFFRWYEQERREGWDSLQWRSFERRIRAEMTGK